MPPLRFVSTFAVLAAMLALAPAAGARTAIAVNGDWGAPQLAGDEVVFAHEGSNGTLQIRTARPGEPSRPLRTFKNAPGRDEYALLNFGASPDALAVAYERGIVYEEEDESMPTEIVFEGGPLGGPWRRLPCRPLTGPHRVSGTRVALTCFGASGGEFIRIEDLVTGAEVARVDPPAGTTRLDFPAIAGDYVTFQVTQNSLSEKVVWNYVEGREVYRVPSGPVALQADGKLAAGRVTADGRCLELRWHQPGDATGNRIGRCIDYPQAIAGDRVAYTAAGDLVIASLDGSNRTIDGPIANVDLDEKRVLYRCAGENRLFVEELNETGSGCGTPEITVAARSVTATDTPRSVALPVACELGCKGSLVLRSGGRAVSTTRAFAIPAYSAAGKTVTVKLRSQLKLPRRVRATIKWRDHTGAKKTFERTLRVSSARR